MKNVLSSFLSRFFPKQRDLGLHIDASTDGNFAYVDVKVEHDGVVHRLNDLKNIPSKIEFVSGYVKISKKNRHTLRQLADWDPTFDPRRGFVFSEKEVPEILNLLRSKATANFAEAAKKIIVDNRPLDYVHDIRSAENSVEIKTSLSDPDARVQITPEDRPRLSAGSDYVHVTDGYFKKPPKKNYQTFEPTVGTTRLTGDQIPLFLLYDLHRLKSEKRTVVSSDVERQKVVTSAFEPKVSVDVEGSWLTFDVRYEADRFKIPYDQITERESNTQFLRNSDIWIRIDQSTHSLVSHQIGQIPQVEKVDGHFRTPAYHFRDLQVLLESVAKIDPSEAYARFVRSLEDFSHIEDRPLPEGFRGHLRTYQKHGFNWACFLRQYGLNGVLADEMGLGKTVQTLVILLDAHSIRGSKTSLVVCPPSVLSSWEDDMKRFTSTMDLRVAKYTGPKRAHLLSQLAQYDVLFTTYNVVTRDIESLSNVAWEYIVLDEAQKIKNHDTAVAKACRRLLANHKLAVTGTPIENRLEELWSLYDFLMPSYLGSQSQFRERYEVPIVKSGDKSRAEDLKKRIHPFKLRRLKSQVAGELPPKIEMDRYCELKPEQVELYKKYASAERERIENMPGQSLKMDTTIFAALMRLKQICCHPALVKKDFDRIHDRSGKLETFLEVIDEIIESGEKALIFSQFTEMLALIRRAFDEKQIKYYYLDGSLPEKKRAELKLAFQEGHVPFFLISLRAGGTGLTLTEANCVIHYDRWWNPAVEDQATDRVHRIGQTKTVRVFRLHTSGTIEERIGKLLKKKKGLFDSIIEPDDLKKEISKDELLSLFAPPT